MNSFQWHYEEIAGGKLITENFENFYAACLYLDNVALGNSSRASGYRISNRSVNKKAIHSFVESSWGDFS